MAEVDFSGLPDKTMSPIDADAIDFDGLPDQGSFKDRASRFITKTMASANKQEKIISAPIMSDEGLNMMEPPAPVTPVTANVTPVSAEDPRFSYHDQFKADDVKLPEWIGGKQEIIGGVAAYGRQLLNAPPNVAASVIKAIKGREGATVQEQDKGVLDWFIQNQDEYNQMLKGEVEAKYGKKSFVGPLNISEDIATLGENLGFSGASALVGVPAGLATAAATTLATANPVAGAVAGYAAGGAASGVMAYRMSSYQHMKDIIEKADRDKRIRTAGKGKEPVGLTAEEETALRKKWGNSAIAYGLAEAVPEALGNVGSFKVLMSTAKKELAKKSIVPLVAGALKALGIETGTETVTQQLQQPLDVRAGLQDGSERSLLSASDWADSFKEILPGTVLLVATMGSAGYAGARVNHWRNANIIKDAVKEGGLDQIPDQELTAIARKVAATVEARPNDEKLIDAGISIASEFVRRKQERAEADENDQGQQGPPESEGAPGQPPPTPPQAPPAPESPVKSIVREVLQGKAEAAAQAAMAQQQATPSGVSMPNLPPIRDLLGDQAAPEGKAAAPGREPVIPEQDTKIGENINGEQLYQREDGSVYRMRFDSESRPSGYPDFGGDLAPASPESITLEDAPDQPTPDFWKSEDGKALRAQQQRMEDTKKHLQENGYKITEKKLRSEKGEADLYKKGYRPYVLQDGNLVVHVAGIWAKPPGQPAAKEASTLAPPMAEEVTQGPPEKAVAAKEPWEMTRKEYVAALPPDTRLTPPQPGRIGARVLRLPNGEIWNTDAHGQAVLEAIQEGKPVPPEVLKDYPELKPPIEGKGKQPPIVKYREEAIEIESVLPPIEVGYVRLWRGNRPGEIGQSTQFTNDLPGIALPFRDGYKGTLSYVDVHKADLAKYEQKVGAAPGAEFNLPKEIAQRATPIKPPIEGKGGAKKLTYDEFAKQYQEVFDKGNKYTPKEAGFNVYTDKMARLADEYPEFLERLEAEQEAKAGAKAEPAPAPEPTKEDAQAYKVGDRVVIDGKHGAISRADKFVMRPIFGKGAESITYSYSVKYDSGRESAVIESQMQREKERPTGEVVPDILVDISGGGRADYHDPGSVVDSIQRAKKRAGDLREAAGRARKPNVKVEKNKQADAEASHSWKLQKAFDEWAAKYPAEAEKYRPIKKTATGAAPATAPTVTGDLSAYGLNVNETTTNKGTPVWNVSGNTREHMEAIKKAGGRWYGPKKVWSFYDADPTAKLLDALGGKKAEVPAGMPKETASFKQRQTARGESIGKNMDGEDVYEDDNGIRSIVENGIRQTEPVAMIPTRGGVQAQPKTPRDERYQVLSATALEALGRVEKPAALKKGDKVTVQHGDTTYPAILETPVSEHSGWVSVRPDMTGNEAMKLNLGSTMQVEKGKVAAREVKTEAPEPIFKEGQRVEAIGFGSRKPITGTIAVDYYDDKKTNVGISGDDGMHHYADPNTVKPITAPDLSAKTTQELVGDIFSIINDHIGERGSISGKPSLEESLYQKLKPYIIEIAKRAKAKALDVKAYLYGAVDSMPEGKAKGIYEQAADRYLDDENALDITDKGSKLKPKEGGEGHGTATDNAAETAGTPEDDRGRLEGKSPAEVQRIEKERGAGLVREEAGSRADEELRSGNQRDTVPGGPRPESAERLLGEGEDAGKQIPESVGRDSGDVAGLQRPDRGRDYRVSNGELTRQGGWKTAAKNNLDAIELVKKLEAEKRPATPEEQSILVKYVGWGASELANKMFPGVANSGELRLNWADKDWHSLVERLSELMTPEEIKTAARSTQYAHYTSEPIIRSIYNALARFGFTGGKILEPGMGSGNFIGLLPDSMKKGTKYTGVEMDHITAKIAGYLYPQQNIIQGDFTKQALPKDFFDLSVGNPPFANIKILADPEYKKNRFSLHEYFFAKSIDRTRPGGLLVFVTSRYVMDKIDDKARGYLADRADLIGAIRLPQTAFKQNAGTEVVTDVMFFRKRAVGETPAGKSWQNLKEVSTPEGQANINEYFADHPAMVLGRNSLQGSMYRKDEYTVLPLDGSIEDHFAKAIETFPVNVYDLSKIPTHEIVKGAVERDFNPKNKKEGGIYLSADGKIMQTNFGSGEALDAAKHKLTASDTAWLKDYIGLRDSLKQAQYDQLNEGEWEKSLDGLKKSYHAFVKKHGRIQSFTILERKGVNEDGEQEVVEYRKFKNERLWKSDVENSLVTALEVITEDGDIIEGPFLQGRTIKKPARVEVKTVPDALAVSLDEIGKLDLDHIAKTIDLPKAAVIDKLGDLIFEEPGKGYILADEYLSGDVVKKLEEAQAAASIEDKYKKNVAALEKVQPVPLTAANITVNPGSNWMPMEVYDDFVEEILGLKNVRTTYSASDNTWGLKPVADQDSYSYRRRGRSKPAGVQSFRQAGAEWGTSDRGPNEIFESLLNNSTMKVTRTERLPEGGTRTYTDEAATTAVNDIAKRMRDRFNSWVWQDADRANELLDIYNKRFNNLAGRRFDGSHLTLPGVSLRFKLHDHQKRAIWRIIQTGNTYLGHAVGAGKTAEMICAGMEMKRLGLIDKPLYVVPNHMLQQFANEFQEFYPLAHVMVADEENFHTDNRRRFIAQATLNNPDAIVMTHSSFGIVKASAETIAPVREAVITELRESLSQLEDEGANRFRIKRMENRIEQTEQRFDSMVAGKKDQAVSFEEMGVDFIFVDEAHQFRKLDFTTNRQAKGITPEGSMRAMDLYIKTQWLEAQNPGRSHVFASGTPVTNTMGELYSLMKFFIEPQMEQEGLKYFDSWANMFGQVVTDAEMNAAGRYELVERFSRFVNIPELMSRVRSFMDVITMSQLGAFVTRPEVKGGTAEIVIAPASDELKSYQTNVLQPRIKASRKWKPSREQKGNPDPMINIITDGRLASIDMRFVAPSLKSDPKSKFNTFIDGIIKGYKETKALEYIDPHTGKVEPVKGGTQIVFYNLGLGAMVAKNRGFDGRAWMMKRFKDAGIPASEIAWIDDYATAAKKEHIMKEMRQGRKRILIGSAKKMGTGINVQKRLCILHYMDPPWYPADVEQPDGRILRQGNQNKVVELKRYATKGSYDATQWQMVARKARSIEQAFLGDPSVRSMEDLSEASQYAMASALASGDERAIKLVGLQNDAERLSRLREAHEQEQTNLRQQIKWEAWRQESAETKIKNLKEAVKVAPDYITKIDGRIGNRTFDNREDFGNALLSEWAVWREKTITLEKDQKVASTPVGSLNGVKIEFIKQPENSYLVLSVTKNVSEDFMRYGSNIAETSPDGLITKMVNYLNRLDSTLRTAENERDDIEEKLAVMRKRAGAPFEYARDLSEKIAEAAQLEAELLVEGTDAPTAADAIPAMPKPEAKDHKALREQANQKWEDVPGGIEYPTWVAGVARAKAILASYGEGKIEGAQDLLEEAKQGWDQDNEGEPYPPVMETVQKIITSIRMGQGKLDDKGDLALYSGVDITRLPSVLKGLYKNFRLSELWEAYKRPPEVTESKLIIGKYTGAIQMMDQKLVEWAWKINKEIPKDRQVAITNYMQAGGDVAVLQQRAMDLQKGPVPKLTDDMSDEQREIAEMRSDTTRGKNKGLVKGYLDATTLTPEEKQWADAFRARFDEIWQDANDAGIIEDYVENYVRGEWVRPDRAGRKILAMNNAGEFRINPSEAKRKIFQSYFDGEQAGFTPKDKRIGYQVIAAERSIRQAIEARKAIKALMRSTEADGRPTVSVGGAGSYVKDADGTESKAFLVKPNQRGKDTGDYKFLDHPSMRRWKWLGSDTEGRPILMEGNVWIHPAAFGRINALLGKSKIRAFTVSEKIPIIGGTQPFSAALQAGAFVKGTILIGPFHQFHVGEHAVFHKVGPFNPPEIDFDKRPLLKEGVEHGLMLFNHNALYEFGEGLATGGLFHRLPIVGDQLLRYQEWLFQDYIPRLKAAMFEHAVERAEKYYAKKLASGTFTRDQLLDNAAKQANAAFGEMNYKYLGRNPTYQDFLRLSLLAPDFLEARLKFAGQALRPYGKEQSMALLRGALIMGGLAVALSLLVGDDDSPWDIKKPFTVVIGGREYTPRSVQADIVHLISSPRSFWYHRLNPLWGRPLVELSTGRDFYGRQPESAVEAAKNILKSWTPIPAQGLVKDNMGDTILEATINAMMQSIGVTNYPHMSDFQRYAMTEGKRVTYRPTATSRLKSELQRKVQRKDPNAMKDIRAARLAGKITDADMTDIIEKGVTDPVQRAAKSMELDDLKKGLKHASAKEMKTIVPIYIRKLGNKYNEGGMSDNALKDYVDSLKEAKKAAQ